MKIFCCGCGKDIDARLTNGREVYPHWPNLAGIPFWRCDTCGNYVGCHHKTKARTTPLGSIPTPQIRDARQRVHRLVDPIWKSGRIKRGNLYRAISKELGKSFHVATICSVEEANWVCEIAGTIDCELRKGD